MQIGKSRFELLQSGINKIFNNLTKIYKEQMHQFGQNKEAYQDTLENCIKKLQPKAGKDNNMHIIVFNDAVSKIEKKTKDNFYPSTLHKSVLDAFKTEISNVNTEINKILDQLNQTAKTALSQSIKGLNLAFQQYYNEVKLSQNKETAIVNLKETVRRFCVKISSCGVFIKFQQEISKPYETIQKRKMN